ncbi:endonuclease/exonuclease/phosphatase family protein [Streptomyces broussonetiae]|uniref:Endonuclease/exonuclease/phosphatase family protein n=1 Tax=Streptomyces broussonetiae TaxID=2686304 RepID=A0ABV5EMA9_9ACTN
MQQLDVHDYGEPVVTVISLNLERDGGPDDPCGQVPQRWLDAHQLLKDRNPDVVLRQEATYSHLEDNRRLKAAEDLLGMKGYLSPNGDGNNPTALFIKPDTFPVNERVTYAARFWRTPPTIVSARLTEVPETELLLMSWHAAFNSPKGREREADEITAFVDKMARRGSFIGGGDANEYPLPDGEQVPPIDWSTVTDHAHKHHRTTLAADGSRVGCTYLDQALLTCGLHDAARYAAHELGQRQALAATAGHARPDQGGPRRIDRVYSDGRITRAVRAVNVLKMTGMSDHDGVEVVYSRRGLAEAQRREHPPL